MVKTYRRSGGKTIGKTDRRFRARKHAVAFVEILNEEHVGGDEDKAAEIYRIWGLHFWLHKNFIKHVEGPSLVSFVLPVIVDDAAAAGNLSSVCEYWITTTSSRFLSSPSLLLLIAWKAIPMMVPIKMPIMVHRRRCSLPWLTTTRRKVVAAVSTKKQGWLPPLTLEAPSAAILGGELSSRCNPSATP